jgi:hypothetical protein
MRITLEGDDRQTLIARLGLSSDVSDGDLQQAVTARILAEANAPTPPAPPATPPAPAAPVASTEPPEEEEEVTELPEGDDQVVLDLAAFQHLERRANRTEHLEEEARVTRRDSLIDAAIKAGKFPPSRREHYRNRFDTDAEATEAAIKRMRDNVVPVKERGVDVTEESLQASDAYPQEWLPERQPAAATATANGSGGRPSRIHSEE